MEGKLVDSKDRRADGVSVDPNSRVAVPDEMLIELESIRKDADDLGRYRREVGRLYQQVNNLIKNANETEERLRNRRKLLAKKLMLSDGSWAIDFEDAAFYRVLPGTPLTV